MKKTTLYILLSWLCIPYISFAANARTEGAGNLYSLSDLSNVLGHPASINDFPDQFMGTAGTKTDSNGVETQYYGDFILKKSIGPVLNVGLIANTVDKRGSSILSSEFYTDARNFILDDSDSSDEHLPTSFPMIPRLVLGLNFDVINFGVDLFVEMARFRETFTGKYEGSIDKGIYNIGGRASTTLVIRDSWICLFGGLGNPHIKGSVKDDSTTEHFSSTENLYLGLGTELGTSLPKLSLVGGVYYTNEKYKFRHGTIESYSYNTDIYFLYLSFKTRIIKDMIFGVGYNLTIWNEDILDPDTVNISDYFGSYLYHNFRMGMEKPFKGKYLWDVVALRSGVIYNLEKITEHYKYSDPDEQNVIIKYPFDAQEIKLNAGIGFQKNLFCVDIFVNIGTWNGVLTGPKAASATITVGLSRDFLEIDRLR